MMQRSPIALFVYNRPWHTKQTIESLLKNSEARETDLFVFSDGPKTDADAKKVEDVRDYISSLTGFAKVDLIASAHNKGLANSIIAGVTKILETSETVIVMEDDLVTSPYFLRYMNEALTLYQNDDTVISIHGYVYPVKQSLPETFFLRGADCWGWATWRRGWKYFEPDGRKLLTELERSNSIREFDMDDSFWYSEMLRDQIKGLNNSWAIRWHASAFLRNKLTLYPGESLINNIGFDNSGTHSGGSQQYQANIVQRPLNVKRIDLNEDSHARAVIVSYMRGLKKSRLRKFASRVRNVFKRIWQKA